MGVERVTLGIAGPRIACITNATKEYPLVFSVLNRWFDQSDLGIPYTSIQVNRGSPVQDIGPKELWPQRYKSFRQVHRRTTFVLAENNGDLRLNELKEKVLSR